MHLKKSFAITFSAQLYSTVVTLIVTPLLISFVGAEGFGLIGFYLILQTWLQILDAGVSGTLSKQIAQSKPCKTSLHHFINSFYKIYLIFACIAFVLLVIGIGFSAPFSSYWFKTNIPINTVSFCVSAMAITLSFKYLSGPLRSALIGLERHALLGFFNIIFTTLRYPAGLAVLYLYNNSLNAYFSYQAIIAFLEWAVLQILFHLKSKEALIKASTTEKPVKVSIKSLLILSAQLSVLSILWVVVSQIDKILLSGSLPLKQFGFYSLAVTIAGVIFTLNIPLNQVLMPRLSTFSAQNEQAKYVDIFIKTMLSVSIVFIPLAAFLSLYGHELVWAWTGSFEAAEEASKYIIWLAIGNTIAIFMNFAFLLRFTLNDLRRHLITYAAYCTIVIPLTFPIVQEYQGEGASIFWMVHNLLFFAVWGSYTFKKYLKHFFGAVLIPIIAFISLISIFVLSNFYPIIENFNDSRPYTFLSLGIAGVCSVSLLLLVAFIFKRKIITTMGKIRLLKRSA